MDPRAAAGGDDDELEVMQTQQVRSWFVCVSL